MLAWSGICFSTLFTWSHNSMFVYAYIFIRKTNSQSHMNEVCFIARHNFDKSFCLNSRIATLCEWNYTKRVKIKQNRKPILWIKFLCVGRERETETQWTTLYSHESFDVCYRDKSFKRFVAQKLLNCFKIQKFSTQLNNWT